MPEDSVLEADTIEDVFEAVRSIPRDLDKHMPTLAKYAARVNTAAEVSKRRESTIALLHGIPSGGMVHSHQVERSPVLDRMPSMAEAEGKGWTKTVEDSSGMEGIEPCELLFIDSTEHTAARLRAELDKFAPNVSRWIIIHDTKLHANNGEDGGPGYLEAMRGFMRDHPQWSVLEHTDRQYGLTVLGCQRADKPKPPSIIKMGVNFAKAVAEHVASGGEKVTVAQLKERLAVCTLCPLRRDARCSACGCNIEAKAAMATQDCPMGKWPYIVDGVTMDDRDLAADHDVVIENE